MYILPPGRLRYSARSRGCRLDLQVRMRLRRFLPRKILSREILRREGWMRQFRLSHFRALWFCLYDIITSFWSLVIRVGGKHEIRVRLDWRWFRFRFRLRFRLLRWLPLASRLEAGTHHAYQEVILVVDEELQSLLRQRMVAWPHGVHRMRQDSRLEYQCQIYHSACGSWVDSLAAVMRFISDFKAKTCKRSNT